MRMQAESGNEQDQVEPNHVADEVGQAPDEGAGADNGSEEDDEGDDDDDDDTEADTQVLPTERTFA